MSGQVCPSCTYSGSHDWPSNEFQSRFFLGTSLFWRKGSVSFCSNCHKMNVTQHTYSGPQHWTQVRVPQRVTGDFSTIPLSYTGIRICWGTEAILGVQNAIAQLND